MNDLGKETLDAAILADKTIGDILKRASDALPPYVLLMLNGVLVRKRTALQEHITVHLSPTEKHDLDEVIENFMKITMSPGEEHADCSDCEAAEDCPDKDWKENPLNVQA